MKRSRSARASLVLAGVVICAGPAAAGPPAGQQLKEPPPSRAAAHYTFSPTLQKAGAAEIRIALADRREFDAKLILQDEKSDIAVLRIEGGDGRFPYLAFEDSDQVEVGDQVLAIGNPFGVGQTVTSGIISALARTEVGQSAQVFIQTDAAINPGNSGGALIDMAGKVV